MKINERTQLGLRCLTTREGFEHLHNAKKAIMTTGVARNFENDQKKIFHYN